MSNQGFSYSFHLPIQNVLTGANLYPEGLDPASSPGAEQKKKNIRPTTPRAPRQINPTTPHKRGGGGGVGTLPIVHCGQTILSTRGYPRTPHSTVDAVRLARPRSAGEYFIVQKKPTSQRIFFHSSASSVPVICSVFYHQSMLIRRRKSRQSYRTRKDNKRKSYQLF